MRHIFVPKTKERAGLYVSKLVAAGIAQIILIVVNISVAYKSHKRQDKISPDQPRDLFSTCFLVFFVPFYLKSLL